MHFGMLPKTIVIVSFFVGTGLAMTSVIADERAAAAAGADQANAEIWRRFIDKHGIMVDFTDLDGTVNYPTPEECREGKPNALGWFQPIENGAMFNGMYLDGALSRWENTKKDEDAAKARRLMEGLLFLNTISDVKGFVGRGVSTDGKSHYAMGSNDQTAPWFFGLWRYWNSPLATDQEKERIVRQLTETAEVLAKNRWAMPAEAPFHRRGSFEGFHFEEVSRKLFVIKLMHRITGDAKWSELYHEELEQRGGDEKHSKQETCAAGMKFFYARTHNWTSCAGVAALRGLWEMETDPVLKESYAKGLVASARLAGESLKLAEKYDPKDQSVFSQDWRKAMMPLWKPQTTEKEASQLAEQQLREFMKISPRRSHETNFVREPSSAAWIVSMCPDANLVREHAPAIRKMIARYDYSKFYYCTFFWVESAWWRLPEVERK